MKSITQLSSIGLAIALVLTSCTMEKRVYMSGYHIEWKKSKHNPDRQELASNENIKETEQNQTVTVEQPINETNTAGNFFAPTVIDDNITASVDNNSVIIPLHKPVSFQKTEDTVRDTQTPETKTFVKQATKKSKANKSNSADGGGKSQLVALLLCIFVGILGIHRFYLGYIGIGVIQLLTLGGFGIWALIDLIMIITGDLKPKGGDYEKKFE